MVKKKHRFKRSFKIKMRIPFDSYSKSRYKYRSYCHVCLIVIEHIAGISPY